MTSLWTCPVCQHDNIAVSRFCGGCGAPRPATDLSLTGERTTAGPSPASPPPSRPDSTPDLSISGARTFADATSRNDPTATPLHPGLRVGRDARYELLTKLGEGGMGTVWKARDTQLGREVAIKRILGHASPMLRERFQRETQALVGLRHTNIVGIHDVGEDAFGYYLVMEYVAGQTLARAIGAQGLPEGQAVSILRSLSQALVHAHKRGVVHRDLKPSNVMLDEDGEVRLLDFGLVQLQGAGDLSLLGVGMGTLDYAAPEQRDNASAVDARADVYSLGALFYALLTGRRPVPLLVRKAPERWWGVLEKACEPEPPERYASMAELLAAVEAVERGAGAAATVDAGAAANRGILQSEQASTPLGANAATATSSRVWATLQAEGYAKPDDAAWDDRWQAPSRIVHVRTGATLVLIQPGEFVMGSPASEAQRSSDEVQHRRVIRKPFYLGKTAVMQVQWRKVMGSNPSRFQGDDMPVDQVNWDDCKQYLQKAGGGLRLPSEAEWEYACRAGTTTPFSFGATIKPEQVNYDGNFPYGGASKGLYRARTVAAGSLPANAWCLHEMHGNVWEWCQDGYEAYPSSGTEEPSRAVGARVLRGGSWYDFANNCRAAYRYRLGPGFRLNYVGLRLARTLPE